jgi:hypothetical protein
VQSSAAYSFTPGASDPEGNPLSFSVMGAPAWASFNTTTGRLSGTPGPNDLGTTEGIVITVSDGTGYASLPAFSLAVLPNTTGTALVAWLPPTQRTDGSPLSDLVGYRLYYGTRADAPQPDHQPGQRRSQQSHGRGAEHRNLVLRGRGLRQQRPG